MLVTITIQEFLGVGLLAAGTIVVLGILGYNWAKSAIDKIKSKFNKKGE